MTIAGSDKKLICFTCLRLGLCFCLRTFIHYIRISQSVDVNPHLPAYHVLLGFQAPIPNVACLHSLSGILPTFPTVAVQLPLMWFI